MRLDAHTQAGLDARPGVRGRVSIGRRFRVKRCKAPETRTRGYGKSCIMCENCVASWKIKNRRGVPGSAGGRRGEPGFGSAGPADNGRGAGGSLMEGRLRLHSQHQRIAFTTAPTVLQSPSRALRRKRRVGTTGCGGLSVSGDSGTFGPAGRYGGADRPWRGPGRCRPLAGPPSRLGS